MSLTPVVRWHSKQHGSRVVVIVTEEKQYIRLVGIFDQGVALHRAPAIERANMRPLDVPLKRTIKQFRSAGTRLDISKRARAALKEVEDKL